MVAWHISQTASSSTWVALAVSQKSDYVSCHLRSPRGITTPAGGAMSSVFRGGKIISNARHGQRVLMKINGCVSSSNKQEGQVPPSRVNAGNGNLPNCTACWSTHTQTAWYTAKVAGSGFGTAHVTSSPITPQSFSVTSSSKWPHKREMHLIRHSIDKAELQGHLHMFSCARMNFRLYNAELWLSSTYL